MASLALPGMSGFVSELSVFVGFSNSDVYGSTFRTVTIILSAVGLIVTPIYLLSMLRQLFYGTGAIPLCVIGEIKQTAENSDNEDVVCFGTNCLLPSQAVYQDAKPREVFIALSFLILIVSIGFYPQLASQLYDVKTVAINQQINQSYSEMANQKLNVYVNSAKENSPLISLF
jgi:NAD(P)H-quinone oxidoreductase subunit 4